MSVSSLRSFDYLEQLPETAFRRLYQQPSTALAIFRRFLPHLAKTLIMAILFMADPMPITHLDSWVRTDSKQAQETAIDVLDRLKILAVTTDDEGPAYRITNPFCNSLRLALTGGGNHRSFGIPGGVSARDKVSTDFLAQFARSQWDNILYYVVGSSGLPRKEQVELGKETKTLLKEAGFVDVVRGDAKITEKGFTFLLQEVDAQVWSLLVEYLEYASQRKNLQLDNVDVLSFLFTVGNLEAGQDYSVSNLTETQQMVLVDLHYFGLVYSPPDTQASCFYPTPLASTLISDSSILTEFTSKKGATASSQTNQAASQRGFIVMETNYRIYAYTSSPLQIQILSLFTKLATRYPNMVSGRLTKESIRRAIKLGITSQQIISYLTAHAHPIMTSRSRRSANTSYGATQQPILPPTVVDQIRLWQIEGDRMKTTPGFLFKKIGDKAEYQDLVKYADQIGVLVWKDDENMRFFVTRVEQLQKFVANRKGKQT